MGKMIAAALIACLFMSPFTFCALAANPFLNNMSQSTASFLNGVRQDEKVTVEIVARPLDKGGETVMNKTLGAAAHYQIVARDQNGKVLTTFGWTGPVFGGPGRVLGVQEEGARIERDYNSSPKWKATMSYSDFLAAKAEWDAKQAGQNYAMFNSGFGGLTEPRKTDGVYNNQERMMSIEIFEKNCQRAAFEFMEIAKDFPTFKEQIPFSWPLGIAMAEAAADIGNTSAPAMSSSGANAPTPPRSIRQRPMSDEKDQVAEDVNAKEGQENLLTPNAHPSANPDDKSPEGVAVEYFKAQGVRDFGKVKALALDELAPILDELIASEREKERDEFYSRVVRSRVAKYSRVHCTVEKTVTAKDGGEEEFAEGVQMLDFANELLKEMGRPVLPAAASAPEGIVMVKVSCPQHGSGYTNRANIFLKRIKNRWRVLASLFQGEPDFSWLN
ncbi:MAG: hypothetical protein IJQ73_10925 [Kiritimatiellae bacterium]|nr:hypothetical protein [Kiritimatiellia bacterium]